MIKINARSDSRIAEDFPDDPYSNLTITTETQQLNLQLAFLSMDSGYFSKIDPDAHQIDLSHLKEAPLIKVLHSLYGEQLVANSVSELIELYPIITALEIDDYVQTIEEEVTQRKDILESIQFLGLSYREKLCWDQVFEAHLNNKLRVLEDSKNYLQLSKVDVEVFDCLLLGMLHRYGGTEDKVLNHVMENYFNRRNIKPMAYLVRPQFKQLEAIWLQYHHVPAPEIHLASIPSTTSSSSIFSQPRGNPLIKAERTPNSQQFEAKRRRVVEMEKEVNQKDSEIQQLNQKIEQIKKELGVKPENAKPVTVRSLMVEGGTERVRNRKPTKRLVDLLGEGGHEEIESVSDHRRESGKNEQAKEFKMLHRLGSKNIKKH